MSTADKLITVAENVPKVYHAGQLNVIENTSTLKKSVSGSAILIDDVSPVTHDMAVKVRNKNLIPYPYVVTTQTINGVTFTDNGDGSITVNGTATNAAYYTFTALNLYPKGSYFMSGCPTGGSTTTYYLNAVNATGINYTLYKNDVGNGIKIDLNVSDTIMFSIRIVSGTTVENLTFKPQLELGTTATAYTPYVTDLTAVKVKKQGKNLIPFPYQSLKLGTTTTNGIDFTVYEDGSILINGTATSSTTKYLYQHTIGLLGLKSGITISGNKNASDNTQQANVYFICNYYDSAGKMQEGIAMVTNASGKKTITDDWKGLGIYLHIPSGKTLNNLLIKPQIAIGDTADNYESYIAPIEYTPTADGTVEGVSSLYPNTSLMTDTDGVLIDCDYYRDIDANDIIERTVATYTSPKVKIVGYAAFQYCKALTSVNLPNATYIDSYSFMQCELLKFVNIPNVTNVGNSAFQICKALTSINLPAVTTMRSTAFYNCTSLTTVDFSAITNFTGGVFANCTALKTVIIRNNTMCTLETTGAFSNCTLINGTGGYIYVPSSLVDTYKTATNWVTYASKFRALEDYTVDGTTTGALDESKVST